jgi:hypothetical protein
MSAMSLGCDRAAKKTVPPTATDAERAGVEVGDRVENLYRIYLNGDRAEAKQSMKDAAVLLERAARAPLRVRAHGLWLAYSRLYVLEKEDGNPALAEADSVKARYWYLEEREASGDSPAEAARAVQTMTADKCADIVRRWDERKNDGKGPRFAWPRSSTQPGADKGRTSDKGFGVDQPTEGREGVPR